MNLNEPNDEIGTELGYHAVEQIAARAEDYSESERERIRLANEGRINALRFEGEHLSARERELAERLRIAEQARAAAGDFIIGQSARSSSLPRFSSP